MDLCRKIIRVGLLWPWHSRFFYKISQLVPAWHRCSNPAETFTRPNCIAAIVCGSVFQQSFSLFLSPCCWTMGHSAPKLHCTCSRTWHRIDYRSDPGVIPYSRTRYQWNNSFTNRSWHFVKLQFFLNQKFNNSFVKSRRWLHLQPWQTPTLSTTTSRLIPFPPQTRSLWQGIRPQNLRSRFSARYGLVYHSPH